MLKYMWPSHSLMTLRTLLGSSTQRCFDAAVLVMTIGAGDSPFPQRVMRDHVEADKHILMTGDTQFGMVIQPQIGDIWIATDLIFVNAMAIDTLNTSLAML